MNPPRALQPLSQIPLSGLNGGLALKFAHSDRFAFPRMTAPACRSLATSGASSGTTLFTNASDPAVVCIGPTVATLSLTKIGMPCSGPRTRPARRSLSSCAAIASAFGFVSMTAPRTGLRPAILRRYACVSSRLVICCDLISSCSSRIDASNHGAPTPGICDGLADAASSHDHPPPSIAAPPATPAPRNVRRLTPLRRPCCMDVPSRRIRYPDRRGVRGVRTACGRSHHG